MSSSVPDTYQYLEASKRQEVAKELEAAGYAVERRRGHSFNLTAVRNGERVAIEVVAQPLLKSSVSRIRNLRRRAREQGFNGFRLVVVSPPREVRVQVEGLQEMLEANLADVLPNIANLATWRTQVRRVAFVETDEIEVKINGVRVRGTGVVEISLSSDKEPASIAEETDFPFVFNVLLDPCVLRLREVTTLEVDTSSFYQ